MHPLIGERVLVEQLHELVAHRADIGARHGELAENARIAPTGQYLGGEAVVRVDLPDRRDQLNRRIGRLVQRPVEDSDDVRAGFPDQVGLGNRRHRRDRYPDVRKSPV